MTENSILILDDYQSASIQFTSFSHLLPLTTTTILTESIPTDELIKTLKPYSIIHAMRERTPLPRSLLLQLPNLKFITTTGMKNRSIDLETCKELNIIVSGTDMGDSKISSAAGTVEQTWSLLLNLARRTRVEDLSVRGGDWQTGICFGLHGKTIGLVGVGRLGKSVANVAKAFGMKVIGWSPNLTKERAEEAGVKYINSLEELIKSSDVVTLHLVLAPSTRGIIGRKELGWMKKKAILINTSRGPLVDEEALIETLQDGRILGAGLDVYDVEPLPRDHVLRTLQNVVLSPHMVSENFLPS